MEFCWLRILIGLFVLRKENAFVPERIVRASGEQATLPCESVSPRTRWFWLPLSSRCAEVQRGYVEITWSLTGNEVLPIRFKERLANQTSGSLALRNLVMSDSGTYVCRLPNGLETRTVLEVTAGCHNNVFVSFWWLNASSLRLSCRHCRSPGNFKPNSFRWMLNSKPLGNEHWFEKSNFGSFVQLLSTRRRAWGRWECHSLANHTWVSEICLEPPVREKGAGCASVINPARVNEELYKRKSLEEGPASLHYAQLEYPRRKSASACTQDSSTVYAVIV
nr:megakaryocyte and platelet inhibitory receptor G6b-like isoform X2 [Zootoca vivipara]